MAQGFVWTIVYFLFFVFLLAFPKKKEKRKKETTQLSVCWFAHSKFHFPLKLDGT